MRSSIQLVTLMVVILCPLHSSANEEEKSVETAIEAALRAYVRHFVDDDFEGIADCFRLPASFEGATGAVFQTRNDVVQFYKEAKANIQKGYSYSTLDSIQIQPITEKIYAADVVYSRFDSNDLVINRGRTVYFYKKIGKTWKMILLAPYSTQ